jgi:amidase
MTDELWQWEAARLAQAIRTRAVSSREAVAACLARLQSVNPRVNAVVETLADEALTLADAADRDLVKSGPTAPLLGVPVTTKINADQKGCATTNGVAAFRNLVAQQDSPSIANLRRAGAIVIGRTNAPEFSWRWFTDNELHGETINPWNRARTCGGSSGGAAVAVATGMCPLAQGTDFGGSIRHPAFCCGIAGLRPTLGRVPAYNATTGDRPITAQFMAVHGPLARRVGDLRLALAALAAHDVRDPLVGAGATCRPGALNSDSRRAGRGCSKPRTASRHRRCVEAGRDMVGGRRLCRRASSRTFDRRGGSSLVPARAQ